MSPMMDLVTLVTVLTVLSDISLVTGYQLASDQFRTVEHARLPVITSQARSLRAPLSDDGSVVKNYSNYSNFPNSNVQIVLIGICDVFKN